MYIPMILMRHERTLHMAGISQRSRARPTCDFVMSAFIFQCALLGSIITLNNFIKITMITAGVCFC